MEVDSEQSSLPLRRSLLDALDQLERAHYYACNADTDGDPWQFAVEWSVLERQGIDLTDVRWLVARKFVELRREVSSMPAAFQRAFVEGNVPRLTTDAVFILTNAGRKFVQSLRKGVTFPLPDRDPIIPDSDAALRRAEKPHWDADRRELWFRCQIVKQFRVPAANQELILAAFEEESWPPFIDDPLPRQGRDEPTRRLQATIKSLNRRQRNPTIRFRGNGGEKVWWEESN